VCSLSLLGFVEHHCGFMILLGVDATTIVEPGWVMETGRPPLGAACGARRDGA
jgi:hypothetical protein